MAIGVADMIVADSHPVYRIGLKSLLAGIGSVLEASNYRELIDLLIGHDQVIAVTVNLRLPGMNGPAGIRELRARFPTLRIIVVSARTDRAAVLDALTAGAHGFMMKTMSDEQMIAAIRLVLQDQIYVPTMVADMDRTDTSIDKGPSDGRVDGLTQRQRQSLELMALGKSNKEIARCLCISESTVKAHLNVAFRVLGVHSRTGAANLLHKLDEKAVAPEPALPGLFQHARRVDDTLLN